MNQIIKNIYNVNAEKIMQFMVILLILYGLFSLVDPKKYNNKYSKKEHYVAVPHNSPYTSCKVAGWGKAGGNRISTIKWRNHDGFITAVNVIFSESNYNSKIWRVYLQIGSHIPISMSEETTETGQIFTLNNIDHGIIQNGDILSLIIITANDVNNICIDKPTIQIVSRITLSCD